MKTLRGLYYGWTNHLHIYSPIFWTLLVISFFSAVAILLVRDEKGPRSSSQDAQPERVQDKQPVQRKTV